MTVNPYDPPVRAELVHEPKNRWLPVLIGFVLGIVVATIIFVAMTHHHKTEERWWEQDEPLTQEEMERGLQSPRGPGRVEIP